MRMGSNELLAGRTRLGSLIDGDERTPEITAMLENTGEEIHLVVPLKGMMGRDPYERWFTGTRINYGDDPDRKLFAYRPPRILMFHDVDGPVALVGCRARGFSSSFTRGRGVVDVKFAVLAPDTRTTTRSTESALRCRPCLSGPDCAACT